MPDRNGPDAQDLEPESPSEAGVAAADADFSHTEGAHVLASEAREELTAAGFTEEQVLEWAETYVSEQGGGDLDAFIAWVRQRQQGR